jgi:hypothetical protein
MEFPRSPILQNPFVRSSLSGKQYGQLSLLIDAGAPAAPLRLEGRRNFEEG